MSHKNFDIIEHEITGNVYLYVSGKYYHLNNNKKESHATSKMPSDIAANRKLIKTSNLKDMVMDLTDDGIPF